MMVWREDDDGDETAVTLSYTISPYYAETRYQPAEGGEIDLEASVAGVAIEPTDAERAAWEAHVCEHHVAADGPDPDDARDRLAEDRMTGEA